MRWRWEVITSGLLPDGLLRVLGSPDEACIWRLGSSKGALAEPTVLDVVEVCPTIGIANIACAVGRKCWARGWSEFEGMGVLRSMWDK